MADETELEAPETEVEAPEEQDAPESEGPIEKSEKADQALTELERVASQVGWIPEDQYRGPKEKWRSAEDFLRAGAEISREFKSRIQEKDREFAERARRAEKMAEVALERQKKQLEDHYKAQLRYAASQGDLETYSAVEKARDKAIESFEQETAPVRAAPEPQNPQHPPEVVDFMTRNSWFNRDPVMTGAAVALCGELTEQYGEKVPLSAIMAMVENQIREEFPHKIAGRTNSEPPKGPPRVEGGQRAIKTSVKKGWDHLPAEAKQAGKKFIDQGIFGDDPAKARQLYADDYWSDGT
jgi:hypothetical protein